MDVIKVRLQTQNQLKGSGPILYNGFSHAGKKIILEEGIIGVWTPGLVASMLREISYSSLRIGLYPMARKAWSTGGLKFNFSININVFNKILLLYSQRSWQV